MRGDEEDSPAVFPIRQSWRIQKGKYRTGEMSGKPNPDPSLKGRERGSEGVKELGN